MRQAFGRYALDMLKVLNRTPCPEETYVDGANAWKKANNNIYSILYLHTEGSANITVRARESTEVDCWGDGVAAWKAFKERFDGNRKEARRACREKLFTTTMPSGGDPTDFTSTTDDLRLRLADMGDQTLNDIYADLLLTTFPKEFAFIKQIHQKDRFFTLEQIKQTVIKLSHRRAFANVVGTYCPWTWSSNGGRVPQRSLPPVQSFRSLPA